MPSLSEVQNLVSTSSVSGLQSALVAGLGVPVGLAEGAVRAIAGAPGLPADLVGLVDVIAKATGASAEGNLYDQLKRGEFDGAVDWSKLLKRGSAWYIDQAAKGIENIGGSGGFGKEIPIGEEPLRAFARAGMEFAVPGAAAPRLALAGGRALTKTARQLIDKAPDFAAYGRKTPPPINPVGGPRSAAEDARSAINSAIAGPMKPGASPLVSNPEIFSAAVGGAAGLVNEGLRRNEVGSGTQIGGSLATALGLSILGRGIAGNPNKWIKDKLPDEKTMDEAAKLMAAAKANGIDLSPSEALSQVHSHRIGSAGGDAIAYGDDPKQAKYFGNRDDTSQVHAAVQRKLDQIAGPESLGDQDVPKAVAEAAAEAFDTAAQKMMNTPAGKLFDAAANTEVDLKWVQGLRERALAESMEAAPGSKIALAYKKFADLLTRKVPVTDPKTGKESIKTTEQLRIGALHDGYRELRETLEKQKVGGEGVPQQRLAGPQRELESGLEAASPEFQAAMEIYREMAPRFDQARVSSAGRAAEWGDKGKVTSKDANARIRVEDFNNLLLPNDGKVSVMQIKNFFNVLKRGDSEVMDQVRISLGEAPLEGGGKGMAPGLNKTIRRKLVAQMLSARLQEAFNVSDPRQGAANYSRKFYFRGDRQEAIKQLLKEAADASDGALDADGLVNGFHRLMEVLSATTKSPVIGSQTAGRQAAAAETAAATTKGSIGSLPQTVVGVGQPGFFLSRLRDFGLDGGRRDANRALGEILTREDGLQILKELAGKKSRSNDAANVLAQSIIALVNVHQAEVREQKRSLRGTE